MQQSINLSEYPSLFQTGAVGVSKRYANVTTADVISTLLEAGFTTKRITVYGGKKPDEFRGHCITLEHPTLVNQAKDESYPVVYLRNSFDGSSAFKLELGVYRLICSNGLKAFSGEFMAKIRHVGSAKDKARIAGQELISKASLLMGQAEAMKQRVLTNAEASIFTARALSLVIPKDARPTIGTISALTLVRRDEDQGQDVWRLFNVIQENAMHGKIPYISVNADGVESHQSTRAIRSITRDFSFNKSLWQIAYQTAKAGV
jgi:hypothetical protein